MIVHIVCYAAFLLVEKNIPRPCIYTFCLFQIIGIFGYIIKSHGPHRSRIVDASHLAIVLEVPPQAPPFFIIRLFPDMVEPRRGMCQVFRVIRDFVSTCQRNNPPHHIIINKPFDFIVPIVFIVLFVSSLIHLFYQPAIFRSLRTFIRVHNHIPIDSLHPDGSSSFHIRRYGIQLHIRIIKSRMKSIHHRRCVFLCKMLQVSVCGLMCPCHCIGKK